jgi:hypothetical protein
MRVINLRAVKLKDGYDAWRKMELLTKFLPEHFRERKCFGDLGAGENIILKMISQKHGSGAFT